MNLCVGVTACFDNESTHFTQKNQFTNRVEDTF